MIRRLASDLPSLWRAPSTTLVQRKTIARQLIDDVSVTVEGESERVAVTITWVGGHRIETRVARPVGKLSQLSYHADLVVRACVLRSEGRTYGLIAATLNAEGWQPAKRRDTFNALMASSLFESADDESTRVAHHDLEGERGENEWTLPSLAHELCMHAVTLHSWVRKGWVKGRKVTSVNPTGVWLLWADADELARLRARQAAARTRWPRAST